MRLRRHILLLTAALALSACSFEGVEDGLVENRCSADSDCPGAICDPSIGMCVSEPEEVLRIALDVTAASDPMGGTPATHTFGPYDVSGASQMDLSLPASINVFGRVRWGEERVQADVSFRRVSGLAGAPVPARQTSTVGSPVEAADGMDADYALRVVAEEEYEIIVEPMGPSLAELPPLTTTRTIPGGGDFVRVDIDYGEILGELTELRGVVIGPDEEPVDGLQVRAVAPENGAPLSSLATTGASEVPGEFVVRFDPRVESYVLRIRGGADRPLFPTLVADPAYFFPDGGGGVRILVPMLSRIRYIGTVEGSGPTTSSRVPDAVVQLRSVDVFDDTTGVTGSFETTVTTDSRGRFEAEIFPGTYEAVIIPPASAAPDVGVLAEPELRIERPASGDTLMGQLFQLPERAVLGGEVGTPDMRAMPGATVSALALGRAGETPAARYNRSSDTVTDATGLFSLRLDFGTYDVHVKPPSESGFPWVVDPGVVLGSSATVRDNFEISAPVPLRGYVMQGEGEHVVPVAGAEIRAWGILEGDGASRAVQIGRATAGEDGSYTLLLPARF